MKNLLLALFLFASCSLSAQTKQFKGTWTKISTTYVFEFDLLLKHEGSRVEGYFVWKVVEGDKNSEFGRTYYKDKIGLTGKEYVRGTYNPKTGAYRFRGYKKEDPDLIIGMDTYELEVDQNGNIGGKTNAAGTWLGRINGKTVAMDIL